MDMWVKTNKDQPGFCKKFINEYIGKEFTDQSLSLPFGI
jgi:hypothetical protein